MRAKSDLFDRLKYLDSALGLPECIDDGIVPSTHNGVANLLRKGLGIVAFNILEDFIKRRTFEALAFLSASTIQFEKLPDSLKTAAVMGVLDALAFKSRIIKREGGDWKVFVQDEALKVHSTKLANFELSDYSFFSANSNIGDGEVTDLLRAFGISGGWTQLKRVSDSIGGGLPDLSQTYKNAAARRNSAAHSAAFTYDYQWLAGIKNEILSIAAALDILLSARCRQVLANLGKNLEEHDINQALSFRFLEASEANYRETAAIGGRAKKIWSSLEDALIEIMPKLQFRCEFLIILDSSRRIADWRS